MRKIGFIIPLFLIISFHSESKPANIDSLLIQLKVHTSLDAKRVDILNALAFQYLHKNPKILREYIKESQRIAQKVNYAKGLARSLSVFASSYWVEGEYTFALDNYLQALKIYERIDNKNGIFECYNNVGEIYKKLKNYDLSLIYHEQALDLKKKYLPNKNPVLSYINIGEIYLATSTFELAKEYFEKALILSVDQDDLRNKAYAYAGLGQVYFEMGDTDTGIFYMEKSFDLREKTGDILGMIQSSIMKGDLYYAIKDYALAEELFLLAKKKSSELGSKEYEIKSLKRLFSLDSARGNFQQALAYNYAFNHLMDSLYTLEKESQLARIKTIYDVEKKDKENALLLKDKEISTKMLKYQRMTNIGGAILLLILITLSVLLYRQVKRQVKTHLLLKMKNEEINIQRDKLLLNANKLKELNENLEKTVKERTGIILKKNEKLKEFAYMNAHNVRGPLSNILGLTYLLKKLKLEEEQKELVSHLKTSAEKLDNEFHQLRTHMENEERS